MTNRSHILILVFGFLWATQAVFAADLDDKNGKSSICKYIPDGCVNDENVVDVFVEAILFEDVALPSIYIPETKVVECRWMVPVRCEINFKDGMTFSKTCKAIGRPVCEPETDPS